MISFSNFSKDLISWYESKKRDLPWRKTKDAYLIWVSEIILQQTRVEQGLNYYLRFIDKFPSVTSLAKASEEEVLKAWQGLGYYSRARNMKFAAETIVRDFNGNFPSDYDDILSLKGIGEYTAAAISSFAYKQVYPVVDGNVMRVISRLYGIELLIYSNPGKKMINEKARMLIDQQQPDIYNQAIMEFGALHCVPANPKCEECPFSAECVAFNTGKVDVIPLRKTNTKKRNRYFNYAVLRDGKNVILRKRDDKDIWKNMYDFPMMESETADAEFSIDKLSSQLSEEVVEYKKGKDEDWKVHLLSHQKIHAKFHEIEVDLNENSLPPDWKKVELDDLSQFPMPKLIESYINAM